MSSLRCSFVFLILSDAFLLLSKQRLLHSLQIVPIRLSVCEIVSLFILANEFELYLAVTIVGVVKELVQVEAKLVVV
jgi:hypothetical protein